MERQQDAQSLTGVWSEGVGLPAFVYVDNKPR